VEIPAPSAPGRDGRGNPRRGHGERQRSPEPSVDLHQGKLSCGRVLPVLDHRHTCPAQMPEQAPGAFQQALVQRDTLAVAAPSAGERLVDPLVLERVENLAAEARNSWPTPRPSK